MYDERWQKLPDPERRYFDYGAIFLRKPGIALPFYFKCFPLLADKWVPDMVLNCAGYPSDKNRLLVTSSGKLDSVSEKSHFVGPDREMVVHDIDTKGGQSGAPSSGRTRRATTPWRSTPKAWGSPQRTQGCV